MPESSGAWNMSATGLTVTFGGVDVVYRVDLELRGGEVHALTGENGAGKSSLAKALAGVYRPRLGSIQLAGQQVKFKSPREALDRGVALIHQEPLTFPELNVAENILVANQPTIGPFVDWKRAYKLAETYIQQLGLDLHPKSEVGKLSVAKQQLVELACAMSHHAKVWLFDETTAPLTPKEVEELFQVIRRLRDQGCAIAIVTHHLEEIFDIADRITVLRDGAKVFETEPENSSTQEIIRYMVGRDLLSERFARTEQSVSTPRLELQNFAGEGFQDVSLKLNPGELVGICGLVGAGRTELANAIFGLTASSAGQMTLNGEKVKPKTPQEAIKLGIGLVPEDRRKCGLFDQQSIVFNSTIVKLKELSSGGWLHSKRLKSVSEALLTKLKLAYRSQDQTVSQLSGGNQQKVVLAKWLMNKPTVLILDEPTRGVDVGAKAEVHRLVREQANGGMAVLMISSDLLEVLALSDRILVMRQGTIVGEFEGKGATQDQLMRAATGQVA